MEQQRDFKGVWFPKELWLNDELNMLEKAILVELDSLDNNNHCYASNKYLAEFCQCSESKVSKCVHKLEELGYIEVELNKGTNRIIKVLSLVKNTRPDSKIYDTRSYNLRHSNIVNKQDNKQENLSKDKLENFGKKQPKKKNLYAKCMTEIDLFTFNDDGLKDKLKEYLDIRIKNEDKPLGIVAWRGILKKLKTEIPESDWKASIQQSINREYASFYPVNKKTNRKQYMEQLEGIPHDGRYDKEDHTLRKETF